jgi:hypothetical protein
MNLPRWFYDPRPKSYRQQARDASILRAILILSVLLAFLA